MRTGCALLALLVLAGSAWADDSDVRKVKRCDYPGAKIVAHDRHAKVAYFPPADFEDVGVWYACDSRYRRSILLQYDDVIGSSSGGVSLGPIRLADRFVATRRCGPGPMCPLSRGPSSCEASALAES